MTVAKVTASSGDKKVTELREFLLAGERHETFDLQMENDIDKELKSQLRLWLGRSNDSNN